MCAFGVSRSTRFNPRARAGRDGLQHQFGAVADVSIHAPVRGATTKPASASRWTVFQSTRPCGARQQLRCSFHEVTMFQSTRPCGARPPQPGRRRPAAQVSIHAPVRGATVQGDPPRPEGRPVSIHAPVRGATGHRLDLDDLLVVSIHAPVRGATNRVGERVGRIEFQSTRPCGARLGSAGLPRSSPQFQSTRPCGARPPPQMLHPEP